MASGDGFEDFYRAEYGRMLAIATALCGDVGAAEDLVQDAFVATHRAWDRVSTYDQPGAFVRRVLINRSRSRWRQRRSESAAIERYARREPSTVTEGAEVDDVFWAAVRSLPKMQARCTVLRYVDDLDAAAIAHLVGCSESTVRVHLHRARSTLASLLGLEAD